MEDEMEITREYFNKGHTYEAVLNMLSTHHDISMSLRTLKTWLKELELRRRGNLLVNKCFRKCVF